jgi:hypothetical protein
MIGSPINAQVKKTPLNLTAFILFNGNRQSPNFKQRALQETQIPFASLQFV